VGVGAREEDEEEEEEEEEEEFSAESLKRMRKSVYSMLPSKELKDMWLQVVCCKVCSKVVKLSREKACIRCRQETYYDTHMFQVAT